MSSGQESNKSNSLTPMGRPRSAESRGVKPKYKRKGSPFTKIVNIFKRERNTENGSIPVRPACFVDDKYDRRSASPEGSNSANHFKRRSGKDKPGGHHLWRPKAPAPVTLPGNRYQATGIHSRSPISETEIAVHALASITDYFATQVVYKGRCEWESDSGRQLMLRDVDVDTLSKVEVHALQRLAVNQLQTMEIPVSHGILKALQMKKQRISFNTFNKRRVSTEDNPGVFGQPLTKVLSQDPLKSTSISAASTPGSVTPNFPSPTKMLHPPVSPTSSEPSFCDGETNPTTMLLEALSGVTATKSPRAKRRQSLYPCEPQVPTIVTKAIHHLDTVGVKTEGIFRIPGAKSRIEEIKERFDSGQDVELSADTNPHDVACLLKEFFRSLPEPLMTRELYYPFLATRKLTNAGQRRDALRLLCLLLPQPNRDTLQELLQFLSRVALHSYGIILIDGTEESGNRMTEENLATILGPNILHKDVKNRKLPKEKESYQVTKQDPEELANVCKVMADLITMHNSIFTIPAQLYDSTLRSVMVTDPDAIDQLLKRKCIEQGLFIPGESTDGPVSRSRSSEMIRKISQSSTASSSTLEQREQRCLGRRSRSLSDTQKTLDEAIKNLESYLDEELTPNRQRHYSSNDSAMGESEAMLSPLTTKSEPSTLSRHRQVFTSMDSAFSNNSPSPTNSSEGVNSSGFISMNSDSPFVHTRMSSGISALSAPGNYTVDSSSPTAGSDSPEPAASPHLGRKGPLSSPDTVSLPPTLSPERDVSNLASKDSSTPILPRGSRDISPAPSSESGEKSSKSASGEKSKKRWKLKHVPSVSSSGTYSQQRSPILNSKTAVSHSESQLDTISSDHTPTESTNNIHFSISGLSLDSSACLYEDATVI